MVDKMSETIKEKFLKNSPDPVSIKEINTILYQMQNCVCKICGSNGNNGTGFFCKIYYPDKKVYKPALFTNNHILSENDIEDKKEISFTINNDKKSRKIKIDKNRKCYTNKELDITIIEIKEKKDDIHDFLDLDEDINKDKELLDNIYGKFKKTVYVLHYPQADEVKVSYGLSGEIVDKSINHTCCTNYGSSGSPILSLKTLKVLGIHYGTSNFEINKGRFIKYAIDAFSENIVDISKLNPFEIIKENNFEKLKKLYDYNKYILTQKDEHLETLLHCSVKCKNYEITKFLLEKGINYDEPNEHGITALFFSSGEIKELLQSHGAIAEHFCSSPLFPKGIFIKEKDINKIELIYKEFLKNGLVNKMTTIKKNNKIIGKRFIRIINWLEEDYSQILKNSIPVYHGTRFVSMENIMFFGLKNTGEPLKGHISLGRTFDNKKDWANAIFVTPSIFYASKYAEIIYSDGEEWFIIVEAKLGKNPKYSTKFSFHESTFYNYVYKKDEPTKVEIRIEADQVEPEAQFLEFVNNLCTTSLLFLNKSYLEKAKNYHDGDIFVNNEKIIFKKSE